ncbi:MAG TPA: hypothetical protein VM510_12480 [Caulifigura sp.]|nr:hypothetical protein [Caulifigura sp.]
MRRLNMHEVAGLICLGLGVLAAFVFPLLAIGLVVSGITSVGIGAIKRSIHAANPEPAAPRGEESLPADRHQDSQVRGVH